MLPSIGQHPSQLCIQGFLLFSSTERSLQVQGRGHGGSKRAELVQRRGPLLHFPWQFSFCVFKTPGMGLLGILRPMVKVKGFPSLFQPKHKALPSLCIGIVFKISLTKKVELSAAEKRS